MEDFDQDNDVPPPTKLDFSKRLNSRVNVSKNMGSSFSNRPRPGKGDRAVKLRLLSLMGLLLLVIVAMKEAGKPERWMWLGFQRNATPDLVSDDEIAADDIVISSESLAADSSNYFIPDADDPFGRLGFMPDRIASQFTDSDGGFAEERLDENADANRDPQKTPVAIDFWRSTFVKLSGLQQEAFYQLLRRIDGSKLQPPKQDLPFDAAVESVNQLQKNNQAKMMGTLAVTPKSDHKTELTEDLFAFDQSWRQNVLPALRASIKGDDFTIANQTTIRAIRSIIDPIVMQSVEDLTGIGNPRDKLAWLAIWDSVQRDAQTFNLVQPSKPAQTLGPTSRGRASETSLLQLKGQPQAFRGQPVAISGTALTIRRKALTKTMLNLDGYYELWVDPPERINDGLICVYAEALPAGFDSAAVEVTEKFRSINVPVTIDGRFFKIRSYRDASNSVSHCPVVIAVTMAADFQNNASPAAASWRPSVAAVFTFFIIAGLGAIAIAYAVFRSTQSGPAIANKPVSKRVARSLDALVDDESVMTDVQRVGQLNQQMNQQMEEDLEEGFL